MPAPTPTAIQTTSLQLRRTFAAPREKVFRAWTDPQALKQWFGPPGYKTTAAEVDLRKGGKYKLTMHKEPDGDPFSAFGMFQEVRSPERLVYSWNWDHREIGDTLVTLEFRDLDGRTEVVLTHERFPNTEERDGHNQGWSGCFDRLEQFISKGGSR
jgi:uncharacterized protein YndB with AHSA1/START domain